MKLIDHGVVLLAGLLAGCTALNPDFCDPTTPCLEADRPFCDVMGVYPGSHGSTNTCITPPDILSCAGTPPPKCPTTVPVCNGGRCVQCLVNGDCTGAAAPVCQTTTHTCRRCQLDDECATG